MLEEISNSSSSIPNSPSQPLSPIYTALDDFLVPELPEPIDRPQQYLDSFLRIGNTNHM